MTLWLAPGGAVEPGALFTAALVCEIKEEAGVSIHAAASPVFLINICRPDGTTTLVSGPMGNFI